MKIRFLAPFIWLAVWAGTALRTAQLYLFFDSTTGFLNDSGLFSAGLAALVLLSALIPALYMRRHELLPPDPLPQTGCGLGAVLAAVGVLASAGWSARGLADSGALFPYAVLLAADGLLLIALAALAAGHFRGEALFNGHPALGLLPILSLGIRSVYLFATYTPLNSAFTNLLNLSALALLTAFFCSLAYLSADPDTPPRTGLLLCGCAAAVVSLAGAVPQLICLFAGEPAPASADPAHLMSIAGLGIYTLFFVPSLRVEEPVWGRRFRS